MAKYLQDIQIYCSPSDDEQVKLLGLSTNFLEILYLDSLPKFKTNGVSKVTIKPCRTVPEIAFEVVLHKPEMLQLSKLFNFDAYWKSDKETRKRIALDFLQKGLLEVASIRRWDTKPFQDAYRTVLAKNFVNYRPWSKMIVSPNRKYQAQIWCNYDSDKAEVFVVIFYRKEIVNKTLVTTVQPGDVWIRRAASKLQWVSAGKVKLISYDEKESWRIEINEKNEATIGRRKPPN